MASSYAKIPNHGQMSMLLDPYFFNSIRWIRLYDKKESGVRSLLISNFIKLVLKNVIKLAKSSLKNIFQDSFHEILSQQLTHDRSYIYFIYIVLNLAFIFHASDKYLDQNTKTDLHFHILLTLNGII